MRVFGCLERGLVLAAAVLIVGCGLACRPAAAQYTGTWPPQVDPVLPYRGTYYEIGHGGTGMTVDVDRNGVVFAVFYTFDAEGQPFYYNILGQYEAETNGLALAHGAVIGTLEGDVYYGTGGECIGAGCTYQAPTAHPTDIHAQLTWLSPTQVEVTIGEQTWSMTGGRITVDFENFLEGQWYINYARYWGPTGNAFSDGRLPDPSLAFYSALAIERVAVTPASFTGQDCSQRDYSTLLAPVPPEARLYAVYSVGYFVPDNMIYHDPATGVTGMFAPDICADYDTETITGYGRMLFPSSRIFILGPGRFRVLMDLSAEYTENNVNGNGTRKTRVLVEDYRYTRLPPDVVDPP